MTSIRARNGAAPLKRDLGNLFRKRKGAIRARNGAAPLKPIELVREWQLSMPSAPETARPH